MLIEPEEFGFAERQPLRLRNTFQTEPISFKIKANKQALTARPNSSVLLPGESVEIELNMVGGWQRGSKYMVSWVKGAELASSTDFWKTANSKMLEVLEPPPPAVPAPLAALLEARPSHRQSSGDLSSGQKAEEYEQLVERQVIRRADSQRSSESSRSSSTPNYVKRLQNELREMRDQRREIYDSVARLREMVQEMREGMGTEWWQQERAAVLAVVMMVVGVVLSRLSVL